MGHSDFRLQIYRKLQLEPCEPRLVLAHPTGELPAIQTNSNNGISISVAHQVSGVSYAHTQGLTGHGQTVAIIDSGIAYDHHALGGGFGTDYRVVGGWDFTEENDADPFDDAPAGLHGTHIAGILASNHPEHLGVAPEADLVALRVFNDQGEGSFEWIENALRWVIDNQHNFQHPITTVNLSLGTKWQGQEVPQWAILENEFRELHDQGIFVAVAAGNGFDEHPVVGLSYPATSPHVVAVASHDATGSLSDFSRRSDRVLVAPGENVTSTAPDYLYDFNGVTDDFFTASGTSMATPFISGASILIRQALEQAGSTEVSVENIDEILRNTAQQTFDEQTDQFYRHVDLQAALESITPIDDYGSTPHTAYSLDQIDRAHSVAGTIETRSDIDYFSFSAVKSGTIRLEIESTSQLKPRWHLDSQSTESDKILEFGVKAHQHYTVGIGSDLGTGEYSLTASLHPTTIDLGVISFHQINAKESEIYEFTAERAGILSLALNPGELQPNRLDLFEDMTQLTLDRPIASTEHRLDLDVNVGDSFYFEVTNPTQVTLANLVVIEDDNVNVFGTIESDSFHANLGNQGSFSINGLTFDLPEHSRSSLQFYGDGGDDISRIYLSNQDDSVTLAPSILHVSSNSYELKSVGIEKEYIYSGGGNDTAFLFDSISDDQYTGLPHYSVFSGPTFFNYVEGFTSVQTYSTCGGLDRAKLFGSTNDDIFTGQTSYSLLAGRNYVEGFAEVRTHSNQSVDYTAIPYGSPDNDSDQGLATHSLTTTPEESHYGAEFATVQAYSNQGGTDVARFLNATVNDTVHGPLDSAVLAGEAFGDDAEELNRFRAYSHSQGLHSQGLDQARLYGSTDYDRFDEMTEYSLIRGGNFDNYVEGFDFVFADSNQGRFDEARLYDPEDDDFVAGSANADILSGPFYHNAVDGFDLLQVRSGNGTVSRATLSGQKTDHVFADSQTEQGFIGIAYRSRLGNFKFQLASESDDLHRSLARLIARDDFYRRASTSKTPEEIAIHPLPQAVRTDDHIISAIGFDAVDCLLDDDQTWTP